MPPPKTDSRGLKCPRCHQCKNRIFDSRRNREKTYVRRGRACLNCGHRWSTYEIPNDGMDYGYRPMEEMANIIWVMERMAALPKAEKEFLIQTLVYLESRK